MLLSLLGSDGLNLTGSRHSNASRSWNDKDGVGGAAKSRLRPSNCRLFKLDVDHIGISVSLLFRPSTKDVLIVSLVEIDFAICTEVSLSSHGSFGKGRFKSEKALRRWLFIRTVITEEQQSDNRDEIVLLRAMPLEANEFPKLLSQKFIDKLN